MVTASMVALSVLATTATTKFNPSSVIPDSSAIVVHIPSPAKALAKAEALAAMSGMGGGQPAGWMTTMLKGMDPTANDIDFKKPMWFAVEFPKGVAKPNRDDLNFVGVAGVKPGAKNALSELKSKMDAKDESASISSGFLVVRKGVKKTQKRFAFPKTTKDLRSKSQILFYINLGKMPLDAMGETPEDRAMMKQMLPMMGEMTIGLGVTDAGIDLLVHAAPEQGSPYAEAMKKVPNTTKPLLIGLPEANYGLVFGGNSNSTFDPAAFEGYRGMFKKAAEKEGLPELGTFYEAMFDVLGDGQGGCTNSSFGIAAPGAAESMYVVSSSQCAKPKEVSSRLSKLAVEVNKLIRAASKKTGEKVEGTVGPVGKPMTVGGVTFEALGLKFEEAPEDLPPLAKVPLRYGTYPKGILMSWNASPEVLAAHVKAAKSKASSSAFAGTQKNLLSPRSAEGHLRIGTLAGPFLTGEMAAMKFVLNALPPVGMGLRTYKDGSYLTQFWLPKELAEMVGPFAQMAGLGSGLGQQKKQPKQKSDKGI